MGYHRRSEITVAHGEAMDKLAAIETFHSIAENGSLTGASRRLGKSVPTVVRTLAQLEESLGVRLFNRTTRRIDLTAEGAAYLEETRRLLDELQAAEAQITGRQQEVSGEVAISAPLFFGERVVTPALAAITRAHPRLRLRLHLSDRIEDLVERHLDVAVRIGHLPPSELVRIRVGEVRQVLCGSPELVGRVGAPRSPADLAGRPCVIVDNNDAGRLWPFRAANGGRRKVEVAGPFTADAMRAARSACLAGVGFGLFLSYQVATDVRSGTLVRLLPEAEPDPLPVQLVHASARLPARRVRCVCDALRRDLGRTLAGLALDPPPRDT